MSRGISTNRRVTDRVTCLRQQGIDFVCKYYSSKTKQPEKRITPQEAAAIMEAGMKIVTVYEDDPTKPGYFSRTRGQADATHAHAAAQEIQQPGGSAIYFAVDFDASMADTNGCITDYFEGVKDGLIQAGSPDYEIGVYGSGQVCSRIKEDSNLAKYSWLAESTKWAGFSSYVTFNIKQIIAKHDICQLSAEEEDYEDNLSTTDYGGFPLVTIDSLVRERVFALFNQLKAFDGLTGSGAGALPVHPRTGKVIDAVLPPVPGFAGRAISYALQEWDFWGSQTYDIDSHTTHAGHKEGEDGWYQRVGTYWKEGLNISGIDGRNHETPWSAAFISWLMRSAGAGDKFNYSEGHSHYIYPAIIAKRNADMRAGYWCFRLNEAKPALGDLLCFAREDGIDYDHQDGGDYPAHCDLVVKLNGNEIEVAGGNVGDSVTRRPIPLDNQGYLWQHKINGELLFGLMQNRIA